MRPSESLNLYGMDYFMNEFIYLHESKKLPNKILLSGKKGIGKSTLAYHLINYALSTNEDFTYDKENLSINNNNKTFKLIQNKSHPNFYLIDLIDEKKSIDIGQIREMITYTNKSSFNTKPRFILIDNIENLNKNSVNALLKIVEEPNENIFFILIHNNEKNILPTLKSRCLTFKINLSFDESINISNKLVNTNVFDLINRDLLTVYDTPGYLIQLINFANEKKIDLMNYDLTTFLKLLINDSYYKKNKFVKQLIIKFIELYFLKNYLISNKKKLLIKVYQNFLKKINDTEKFNLDEESLFLEFKSRILNG
ncbi:AAA family ATPase [Candidatus Pelagibacter sp.]|nr:AAA family ATPase [Candidatus Pelagibacter sp.]